MKTPIRTARRRWPTLLLLASASAMVAAGTATTVPHHDDPAAPPHQHLGELAGGFAAALTDDVPAAFWVTPEVRCTGEPAATGISAPNPCVEGESFRYTLDVAGHADVLRIDWDQPFRQDDFALTVTSPSGDRYSQTSHNTYSEGVTVETPETGTWTVVLDVVRTDAAKIRMRAGLVDALELPDGALLPNLRVTPPFEFGFVAPASPLNPVFLAGDDQNPPLTVAGQSASSCASDEVIEAADATRQDEPALLTRCLRLSTGPHNVGAGHFDVRFPIVDRALAGGDRIEEMTQFIHHTDGSITTRPAGTYEYHVTHAHWHYLDILFYEAYLVTDEETGTLQSAGRGRKSGFCPADQGYGEWTTFHQGPPGAVGDQQGANCFATSGNGAMGLSAGWGDFYRWQRSGQYIDFSGLGDGRYVIRATVDVLGNVLESDEDDNTSYAYVCITGDEVDVVERGYGQDPWDPRRVVATDNRAEVTCDAPVPAAAAGGPASRTPTSASAATETAPSPGDLPTTGGGAVLLGSALLIGSAGVRGIGRPR